jgi:hypothetical protein
MRVEPDRLDIALCVLQFLPWVSQNRIYVVKSLQLLSLVHQSGLLRSQLGVGCQQTISNGPGKLLDKSLQREARARIMYVKVIGARVAQGSISEQILGRGHPGYGVVEGCWLEKVLLDLFTRRNWGFGVFRRGQSSQLVVRAVYSVELG